MATAYFAGTSGRLKAVAIAPDLTTDIVTFSGSTVTQVAITEWELQVSVTGNADSITLESATTAQGLLTKARLRGGIEEWSFNFKGQFNPDQNTLTNGVFAVADFLVKKVSTGGTGYSGCTGQIQNYQVTGVSANGGTVMFSATFVGSGSLPAYA